MGRGPSWSRVKRPELVPGAVFGDQVLPVHRAEPTAEPGDVDVHGPAVRADVPAVWSRIVAGRAARPDPLDELRPAEHRGRMGAEDSQQLVLLERQLDLGAVGPDPALQVIDDQPGTGLRGPARLGRRGPEPRPRSAGSVGR